MILHPHHMWCAQFKSAERTFDLSQPVLYCLDKIRTCGLSATHISNTYGLEFNKNNRTRHNYPQNTMVGSNTWI